MRRCGFISVSAAENRGAGPARRNTAANTMMQRQVRNFLQQKTITMVLVVQRRKGSSRKTIVEEDVQAIVLNAGSFQTT
jgi:hypothetical protein